MENRKKLWVFVWTFGLFCSLLFCLLRLLRIVEISGLEKRKIVLPKGGLLVIHRHPSFREPAILPLLFFPRFLFSLKFFPISLPDKSNYYQKWWFSFFRLVCIPIDRGVFRQDETLRQIEEGLREGRIFILAPGGGREKKGKTFKFIKDGEMAAVKISKEREFHRLSSEVNGLIVRRFRTGVAHFLQKTQCQLLPIWIEVKGAQIKIKIGEQFRPPEYLLQGLPQKKIRKKIVEILEDNLLRLGEK